MMFSMSWGRDGVPRLSKGASPELRKLVEEGHFRQKPFPPPGRSPRKRPEERRGFKASATPPPGSNPFGVAVGQTWVDGDPRNNNPDFTPRIVLIKAVGDTHAVAANTARDTTSLIKLINFSGKPKKFSRVMTPHD